MIFPLGFFGHGPKQPKLSTPWNFRSPSVQGLGEPRLRTLLFFQGKRADTGRFPDSLAQSKLWESAACPFFSPHKFHSFWHSEAVDLLLFSEVISCHFFVPPLFPFYSANNTLCISRELLDFPGGSSGKELAYQCRRPESQVRSLDGEDPLEEGMATPSSILAWRIPWTEELAGLQSMGSQRHD